MLIISRRVGESVRFGEDISITVLKVKGDRVRLAISAPESVTVHREESRQATLGGTPDDGQTAEKDHSSR